MICLYRSVLGVDDASFNYRKDVSLHAFSGHVRAGSVTAIRRGFMLLVKDKQFYCDILNNMSVYLTILQNFMCFY